MLRKTKKLTLKNRTLKKLVTIKHFGKLSDHISVIKTIYLLKLPFFKTILLYLMKKELQN